MEQGLGTRQESLSRVWGFAVSVVLAHQVRRCRCCRRRNHRPLLNIASLFFPPVCSASES
jgi:hypothetical protein